ncbi:21 kDa protein-like [Mercurialis annua]|uniref:21 kDa protein-like n=1 Tax=Mercurialis annua TaxID=3986 RepID=UPI00215E962D|nr:21 kDa protein-like [Mercurialis annua]
MAKPALLLLILSVVLYISSTETSAAAVASSNFIKSSCKTTTYPALCIQSLSAFATSIQQNPLQLTQTALSVSIASAQSTKTFVYKLTKFKGLKPREIAALKDCSEEIDDTVDRLGKSLKELKSLGHAKGKDFQWHMSNIETWVSAALTDENTCTDGFGGKALNGKMKSSIRGRIVNVAHVTSNALSLINKYAIKH